MPEVFLKKRSCIINLDAIISIGYRINSIRATSFRIWATSVLKQYMLKGYAVNQNAVASQKYEDLKRAMGLCGTDPDDCRKSHGGDGHDGEGGGEPD